MTQVLIERGSQYGPFHSQARCVQAMKQIARGHRSTFTRVAVNYDYMTSDQQEAVDMILHKLARILNGNPNNQDSWADIAGYAQLIVNRLKELSVSEL